MAPPQRSRPLTKPAFQTALTDSKRPIRSVAFSENPPGSKLVPNVRAISWSPTGSMVATCTNMQIRVWDPERANVRASTEMRNAHNGSFAGGPGATAKTVEKVAFCPRMEHVVASTGEDAGVRLWDVRMPVTVGTAGKGTQLADSKLGDSGLSLTWHPNGTEMLVGTKEDYVKVIDVRRLSDLGAGAVNSWSLDVKDRTPSSPKRRVHGMAFSNSGNEVFVTTGEGPVKILDYPSLETLHTLSGHTEATYCVQQSPLGTWVAAGGGDSVISLWDTETWNCGHMISGHTSAVRDLSFSFEGAYLTAGSMSDGKDGLKGMDVYHVDTGDVVHTVDTVNPVTATEWHPFRYWVAFAGDPGGLKILGAGSAI